MPRPGSIRRSTSQRRNRSRRKPLAIAGVLTAAAAAAFSKREAVVRLIRSNPGGLLPDAVAGARAEVQAEPSAALQADAPVDDPSVRDASVAARNDAPTDDTPAGVYAEVFVDPADVQPGTATGPSDDVGTGAASSAETPELTNYDLSGPAENTATPLPVAPPATAEFDEQAEIAAAAAEAAAIGGTVSPYSSSDLEGFAADAERPLAESGEGVSEGFEQAEAELVDAATPYDTASPYQRQIDEVIDLQDNPYAGERAEALEYTDQLTDVDQPGDDLGASATGASSRFGQEEDTPGGEDEQSGERWSEHHP